MLVVGKQLAMFQPNVFLYLPRSRQRMKKKDRLASPLAPALFPIHWDLTDLEHVHGDAYPARAPLVAGLKHHVALDHPYPYRCDVREHA
jgi:hypothetical protein